MGAHSAPKPNSRGVPTSSPGLLVVHSARSSDRTAAESDWAVRVDRLGEQVPEKLKAMTGGDGRPWVALAGLALVMLTLALLVSIASAATDSEPYRAHSPTEAVEHWCHNVSAIESPVYVGDNGSDEYMVAWSDTSGHTYGALVQSASHTAAAKYQGTYTVGCTYTQVN